MMAYFLKCPATPMALFGVERDGSPRGYFLLAEAPGQVRLVDHSADSSDPDDWLAVVQLAVEQARRYPDAAELVSVGSDPLTCRALSGCGFHARDRLPLRLLAREVYDKIAARVGESRVALITGEEKIKPESPQYWVCTVEAMPQDVAVQFLAVDEIQLAADPERGPVFTDRLLQARGEAGTIIDGRYQIEAARQTQLGGQGDAEAGGHRIGDGQRGRAGEGAVGGVRQDVAQVEGTVRGGVVEDVEHVSLREAVAPLYFEGSGEQVDTGG